MTEAQKNLIVKAFHGSMSGRVTVRGAGYRTLRACVRQGWMTEPLNGVGEPTIDGLKAAGLHAEAAAQAQRELDEQAAHQATPAYRTFAKAVQASTTGYRGALDILHAEALREDFRRRVAAARQDPETLRGTLGGVDMGSAVLAQLIEHDHDEAIKDDVVREARMITPDPREVFAAEAVARGRELTAEGHRPECRAMIYRRTRFESDWPSDPERCDLSCRTAKQA